MTDDDETADYYPTETEFEIWQDDQPVAVASGPRLDALREAAHYASVYGQDGPVLVFEVKRVEVKDVREALRKAQLS